MIAAPPTNSKKRRSPLAAGSAQYGNNGNGIVRSVRPHRKLRRPTTTPGDVFHA
jgi:hypothetical protein